MIDKANPSEDRESTPIADEVEARLNNSESDERVKPVPESAKSFKVDVERALDRTTHDGPGDEDPGESTWISYATEGVEVDD